jgi:hypothetical protein
VSDLGGETATIRLGEQSQRNSIRFAPFGQAPRAPEGRAFVVSGEYESQALIAATEFLVRQAGRQFKNIDLSDGKLRIVLHHNVGWLHTLPFGGDTPAELILVQNKLNQAGDASVLAYAIFVLCWYLEWSVSDVSIEETPID